MVIVVVFIFEIRMEVKDATLDPLDTVNMTSLGPAGSTVEVPYGFLVSAACDTGAVTRELMRIIVMAIFFIM